MFPRKAKLTLRTQVDFFEQAQKIKTSGLSFFYRPTTSQSRVVVIVPKKTARLSTQRNRLKRFIYQSINNNWARLEQLQLDGVIVLHSASEPVYLTAACSKLIESIVITVQSRKNN